MLPGFRLIVATFLCGFLVAFAGLRLASSLNDIHESLPVVAAHGAPIAAASVTERVAGRSNPTFPVIYDLRFSTTPISPVLVKAVASQPVEPPSLAPAPVAVPTPATIIEVPQASAIPTPVEALPGVESKTAVAAPTPATEPPPTPTPAASAPSQPADPQQPAEAPAAPPIPPLAALEPLSAQPAQAPAADAPEASQQLDRPITDLSATDMTAPADTVRPQSSLFETAAPEPLLPESDASAKTDGVAALAATENAARLPDEAETVEVVLPLSKPRHLGFDEPSATHPRKTAARPKTKVRVAARATRAKQAAPTDMFSFDAASTNPFGTPR